MGKSRKTTVTVTVNENFQIEMVLYYEYVVGIQLKYTLYFQFKHSCHFTEILGLDQILTSQGIYKPLSYLNL